MITPKQFLEAFLNAKVTVYAEANEHLAPVYARYFGEPLSKRLDDFLLPRVVGEVVEDVKQSDNSAIAITRQPVSSTELRRRYHLVAEGESWKIVRFDRECFICRHNGKSPTCQRCGGEGWCDTADKKPFGITLSS